MGAGPSPVYALTWGDVKNRIVQDLGNRGYLYPQADQYARGRIQFYTNLLFWPSEQTDVSITTNPGQSTYPLPGTQINTPNGPILAAGSTYQVEGVRLLLNSVWIPLSPVAWRDILEDDVVSPPIQAIPVEWAIFSGQIRFFPVPNYGWPIELTLSTKIPAPVLDADINFWTMDAAELIIAATVRIMCTSVLKEPDRAAGAQQTEGMELINLIEATHRLRGGVRIVPYYA
jgi:hypothetical protein